jgi:hypothetical protein
MTIRGRRRVTGDACCAAELGEGFGTRHDATVSAFVIVLLAGLIWAAFSAPDKPASGAASPRRGSTRGGPLWLLGALLVGLICLRFGVNWLVVLGGVLLALARNLLPLLRLWPFLQSFGTGPRAQRGDGSTAHASSNAPHGRPERMSRQEALQIFGLDAGASQEDVQREYRRLMKKLHPDLGGSSYLAAKVNEARDALL